MPRLQTPTTTNHSPLRASNPNPPRHNPVHVKRGLDSLPQPTTAATIVRTIMIQIVMHPPKNLLKSDRLSSRIFWESINRPRKHPKRLWSNSTRIARTRLAASIRIPPVLTARWPFGNTPVANGYPRHNWKDTIPKSSASDGMRRAVYWPRVDAISPCGFGNASCLGRWGVI